MTYSIKLKPDREGTARSRRAWRKASQNASRLGPPFLRTPAPTTSSAQWKSAAGASPVAGIRTMLLFMSQLLAALRLRAHSLFLVECVLPPLQRHRLLTARHNHLHHHVGSRTYAGVSNLISPHLQVRSRHQTSLRKRPSRTDCLLLTTSKKGCSKPFLTESSSSAESVSPTTTEQVSRYA